MADIFDLAPEGQAWTDNLSKDKAAKPDDYDPSFFAGSLSAFPRGAAEGAIGLAQTLTAAGKEVVSDQQTMLEWAPTYGIFKSMFPGADDALNSAYDSTAKSLEAARQYVKPDATTQGMSAQVLNEFGKFVPAIGATVVAGPAVGAGVAFGSTFESTRQDFLKKGVNPETAATLATEQASFNALGMGLPAAVGGKLLTRLVSGVGINTSFGGINRFAMGETLEDNGYSDMAKQYRVWDAQAIAVDAVLGASFGGLHHWTASRNAAPEVEPSPASSTDATLTTAPNDGTTVQPETVSAAAGDAAATPSTEAPLIDGAPAPTYESRISELRDLASNLLPVGERKALAAEVNDLQYRHDQAVQQLQQIKDSPVAGSGKALSVARARRAESVQTLDAQVTDLRQQLDSKSATLADSSRGGQFFEAKADLSRIDQGIIPESMRGLVDEAPIKPSDVDAAHVMNEGLHYDIESAPVVHGSNESVNAHVKAMDAATRSLMNGEPVNVSQQIRGLDGIAKPTSEAQGIAYRDGMESALRESGVSTAAPRADAGLAEASFREDSAFAGGREDAGKVSTDPDTGEVLSANSFDLMTARDLAADADAKILHPDTGQEVTLAKALADLDEQIATAQKESNVYSVAASCFLRNP